MCVAVLPAIALVATAAATAVGAVGQIQAGKAARAQGEYENRIAQVNAKLATNQAKDAQERGKDEAVKLQRQQALLKGRQIAAQAASGVDVSFGTPVDVQADTAMIGAEDLGAHYKNIFNEMRGYDINAANYKSQGKAAQMRGKAAQKQSLFAAGGTILSGVTQMAGIAEKFGKAK